MGQMFLHFEKINVGLLFESRIEAESPLELVKGEEITNMTEDFQGRVRIETETSVYQQEGYHELAE